MPKTKQQKYLFNTNIDNPTEFHNPNNKQHKLEIMKIKIIHNLKFIANTSKFPNHDIIMQNILSKLCKSM